VQRLLAPRPAVQVPGTASAPVVQRDIEPGKPLPDAASIGQQRVEKRLKDRETSRRVTAGFAAKLESTAWDDKVVDELLTARRDWVDSFYRKVFARQHPTDPAKVDKLVEAKMDETVPSSIQTTLVRVELWEIASSIPGLTPERAKQEATARFPPQDLKTWLAGEIISQAHAGISEAVDAQLKREAADEWQRIAGRAEGPSFGATLSKSQKAAFAGELKKLPSLSRIARAHDDDTDALKMTSEIGRAHV